jgi:hypothetical protein
MRSLSARSFKVRHIMREGRGTWTLEMYLMPQMVSKALMELQYRHVIEM